MTLINLEPGQYTVTEKPKAGYECTSIDVNGTGVSNIIVDPANNKATFTLASEANVTVTFTNKKQEEEPAKLTVVKALDTGTTDPANPWKFELDVYKRQVLVTGWNQNCFLFQPG